MDLHTKQQTHQSDFENAIVFFSLMELQMESAIFLKWRFLFTMAILKINKMKNFSQILDKQSVTH